MRLYNINGGSYASVTTILSNTKTHKTELGLAKWKNRIGEEAATNVLSMACSRGTEVHRLAEQYLLGAETDCNLEEAKPFWNSIKPALNRIKDVYITEQRVHHPELKYAGTFDCFATFDGVANTMIDFKTANKKKEISYITDHFMQLAAYSGAWYKLTGQQTNQGVVIIGLANQPAQVFKIDRDTLLMYWQLWIKRLELFRSKYPDLYKKPSNY